MRFTPYGPEAVFALQAVRTASRFVHHIQRRMVLPSMAKDDASPVTVADFASQAVLAAMLEQTFPDDPLVAEEGSQALQGPDGAQTLKSVVDFVTQLRPGVEARTICAWVDRGTAAPADRFWVLDPIDGTKGFLRGDHYVVALALVCSGQVVVGALGCPGLDPPDGKVDGDGSAYLAVTGQGTWAADLGAGGLAQVHVSRRTDPRQARILRSFEASHTDEGQLDRLARTLGCQTPPERMDSQAKYALMASGKADLLFRLISPARPNYREKIWDQAAGSIVVEEAGGRVTDLEGKALDFTTGRELVNNTGVLASNTALHGAALRALKVVGAVDEQRMA